MDEKFIVLLSGNKIELYSYDRIKQWNSHKEHTNDVLHTPSPPKKQQKKKPQKTQTNKNKKRGNSSVSKRRNILL